MKVVITRDIIVKKAKVLAKEIWGMDFDIPVKINSRLTKSLGRYIFNKHSGKIRPVALEMSQRIVNGDYEESTVDSVILHELTHWALSVQGKQFNDGNPVFEAELKRIGASSTNTIRKAGTFHQGVCGICKRVLIEKDDYDKLKKYFHNRYHSKCCKGSIEYGGIVHHEDKYQKQMAYNPRVESALKAVSTSALTNNPIYVEYQMPVIPVNEEPVSAASNSDIDINKIVQPGPKGFVSNTQLIPIIKEAVNNGDGPTLRILRDSFPSAWDKSQKYLSKNILAIIEVLM